MARYTAGAHTPQSICNLLRSLEILCFSLAALIALGVWAASDWLAYDWLRADKLPTATVAQALSIMALVAALRFAEGIYKGALFGLQRQVWYNGAQTILSTVRHGGAVAVLAWISPTVQAFFLWQIIVSLLSVVVFAASTHHILPVPPLPPRFSRQAVAGVWKFAGGMLGTSLLVLLLTQVDKVLLSRMLTLEFFGYYAFAAAIVGVLSVFTTPIAQAVYPRMVELVTQSDQQTLISVYHDAAQLLTNLSAPGVMVLIFFAEGSVFTWSGDASLAENTAPILSVLVIGTFLNGLLIIPYMLQLAHGWTSLGVKANFIAVVVLVPAIFLVVPRYGAVGAAWIWVALNASYVLIGMHVMHHWLIPNEKWGWYLADVLLPIGGPIGIMLLAQQFQPASYQSRWQWLAFLLITGGLALLASTALADRIRPRMFATLGRVFRLAVYINRACTHRKI
jgi:O-antigen/teichoic acid export membrane protein